MGGCSNLCSRVISPLSDITVNSQHPSQKNISSATIAKYKTPEKIKKINYLISRIKGYQFRKKGQYKSSKYATRTKMNSSSNNYSKTKSLKKTTTDDDRYNGKKSNKNINKSKFKNNKTIENQLNIPQVHSAYKRNKFFQEDPFSKPLKDSKDTSNDPRNGPMDNVRRRYPKIEQDEFSYEGEWKNRKRDGVGVLIWKSVAKFIGEFLEDRVWGFGILHHDDGDEYMGYWEEFQAKGVGKYHTKKIMNYDGYWDNDKQNGFGLEKWPRNTKFEGEYLDGNKEGLGVLNIEDKGTYQGELKNGNINGIGKFVFSDGRTYEGEFVDNKMEGYGIITWPDGKIFVGEFREDIQDGFGVFYSRKKIYIGIWKNSFLEGDAIIVENDKIKKQFWEEGGPSENLPNDSKIIFEKYVDDIIKEKDYYLQKQK